MKKKSFQKLMKMIIHLKPKISFIYSPRGVGKTYWASREAWRLYKKGKSTLFLRRFKTELQVFKHQILRNLEKLVPNEEFVLRGNKIFKEKDVICEFFAVSSSARIKGAIESNHPGMIVYDEIDSVDRRYTANEVQAFLDIVVSFFRKHRWRVFCFSNQITANNPIVSAFKLDDTKINKLTMTNNFLYLSFNEEMITFPKDKNLKDLQTVNSEYFSYVNNEDDYLAPWKKGRFLFQIKYLNEYFDFEENGTNYVLRRVPYARLAFFNFNKKEKTGTSFNFFKTTKWFKLWKNAKNCNLLAGVDKKARELIDFI